MIYYAWFYRCTLILIICDITLKKRSCHTAYFHNLDLLAVIFLLDFLNRVIDEVINNDEGQKEVKIDLLWHCQIDCPIDIYNTEGARARISEKDETQQDINDLKWIVPPSVNDLLHWSVAYMSLDMIYYSSFNFPTRLQADTILTCFGEYI